ncbi:hypothetical protein TrCOL_g4009 [Triparma columacea]|uniref:Uncharacterized protein n=1 Tax=Triparma columacea TaxID=722753 RepID=A0A9W7GHZ0_9STRA|nr:hypothetical protein TrCOL_g4009 [Triparma columacea]
MSSTFPSRTIINLPRDFYSDVSSSTVPPFDMVITNPPYSSDHKSRCLGWLSSTGGGLEGVGYACLLPSYCVSKGYYRESCLAAGRAGFKCFVIEPLQRYDYDQVMGKGFEESPFMSSWFCAVREGVWGRVREAYEGWEGGTLREGGGGEGGKRVSSKRRRKIKEKTGAGREGGREGGEGGKGYGVNQRKHNEGNKKRKEEGKGREEGRKDEGKGGGKSKYRDGEGKRVKRRF